MTVAIRRPEQALNRNGFLQSRARQLQRTLDSPGIDLARLESNYVEAGLRQYSP
jgi:hypothetical protein